MILFGSLETMARPIWEKGIAMMLGMFETLLAMNSKMKGETEPRGWVLSSARRSLSHVSDRGDVATSALGV